MKNLLKSIIILISLIGIQYSNAQVTFEKTFGGSGEETGTCVKQLPNGDYVLMGYTTSYGAGDRDIIFIKTDSLGNQKWAKTIGGADDDYVQSLSKFDVCDDGGFIFATSTKSYGQQSDYDVYVIKTDSSANVEWSRTFDDSLATDYGYAAKQTFDGGFIIGASSSKTNYNGSNLIKLDNNGNIIWNKKYVGLFNLHSLDICSNGDFIFGGYGGSDKKVVRVDSNGDIIWVRDFGVFRGHAIKELSNGDVIVAGAITSNNSYILKCTASGNLIWLKEYKNAPFSEIFDIIETNDNNIVFAGMHYITNGGVLLVKADIDGTPIWSKTFDKNGDEIAHSVIQTRDNGFAILGYSNSFDNGFQCYLIKTDESGSTNCNDSLITTVDSSITPTVNNVSTTIATPALSINSGYIDSLQSVLDSTLCYEVLGCTDSDALNYNPNATTDDGSCIIDGVERPLNEDINIYPNPVQNKVVIRTSNKVNDLNYQVINQNGETLKTDVIKNSLLELDVTSYPSGKYSIIIQRGKEIVSEKIIIL